MGITNGWAIHDARLSLALNKVFTNVDLPRPDAPRNTKIYSWPEEQKNISQDLQVNDIGRNDLLSLKFHKTTVIHIIGSSTSYRQYLNVSVDI